MNRIQRVCLLVCVVTITAFGEVRAAGDPVSLAPLTQLLDEASADVGGEFPDLPVQLTWSGAFVEVWRNPSTYRDAALRLLQDPKVPDKKKLILAYAMQGLCLKDLLALDVAALNYWKRGVLRTEVLDTLIFPVYDWNTRIQEKYERPEVMALLQDIERAGVYDSNPRRLNYLKQVMSGKAAKDVSKHGRAGQLPAAQSNKGCVDS